jgi:hypothetical protein
MSTDNTAPNWTTRILASFAVVVALVGGLGLFNLTTRDTKSPTAAAKSATAVATSCSGFKTDAHKLLDQAGTAALTGTFAPGDHVHLAIDLNGADYSWELTGALGKKPNVKGSGWSQSVTSRRIFTKSITPGWLTPSISVSRGDIQGYARLEMEIDVTTAGDGAITLTKTGSAPSSTPSKVVSAICKPAGKKSLQPMA